MEVSGVDFCNVADLAGNRLRALGDSPTIVLRVVGTNIAYRPPSIRPTAIGRQKRKGDDPMD
jgi:hypothetical protein